MSLIIQLYKICLPLCVMLSADSEIGSKVYMFEFVVYFLVSGFKSV